MLPIIIQKSWVETKPYWAKEMTTDGEVLMIINNNYNS